jgi:hypothetical protein
MLEARSGVAGQVFVGCLHPNPVEQAQMRRHCLENERDDGVCA